MGILLVPMKSKGKFALVLVTAPDLKTARKLAKLALDTRLVACANLIPRCESHYWWQGKIERSSEILILLKATTPNLPGLEKLILKNHPYDVPEFVLLPIEGGNKRYLDWWRSTAKA